MPVEENALIEDGFSVTTTIARVPGLHPAVTIRFRPALSDERYGFQMITDLDGKARVKRIADILKRHLETWDIRTRAGTEASHKDENILRKLQPTLLAKMLDLVLGYMPIEETQDEKNSAPASSS